MIRSHSLKLLSTLLETDESNPSILELDMFGILVSLTYSLPSLFNGEGPAPLPSCNIQDNHILRLVFLAHITQIIFSLSAHSSWPTAPDPDYHHCPPARECLSLVDLVEVVTNGQVSVDPQALWQVIMEQSLGFLRCSALFYHYLSGVSLPAELTSLLPPDLEFISLAKYLSLPYSPKHLLDSPFTLLLARKWSAHSNIQDLVNNEKSQLNFSLTIPRLISLPGTKTILLITHYYKYVLIQETTLSLSTTFPTSRVLGQWVMRAGLLPLIMSIIITLLCPRIPCMCLVCGTVVCGQSFCCQSELEGSNVGACTAHTAHCGCGQYHHH